MDQEIEELKDIVKQQGELIEDTNRQIHKLRRGARWAVLFRILWWLVVAGVTSAFYYYYLQPYIDNLIRAYQNVQHGAQQAQNFQSVTSDFFSKAFQQFFSTSTPK